MGGLEWYRGDVSELPPNIHFAKRYRINHFLDPDKITGIGCVGVRRFITWRGGNVDDLLRDEFGPAEHVHFFVGMLQDELEFVEMDWSNACPRLWDSDSD